MIEAFIFLLLTTVSLLLLVLLLLGDLRLLLLLVGPPLRGQPRGGGFHLLIGGELHRLAEPLKLCASTLDTARNLWLEGFILLPRRLLLLESAGDDLLPKALRLGLHLGL